MSLTAKEELELLTLLEQEQKENAKTNYVDYVEYVHRGAWIRAPHVELVCKKVELLINNQLQTEKGEIADILIVGMPPQHGKSQSVTETLPSYYLGRYPKRRVIEVSYGDDLARRFGRRNKQKINEFGKELFDIELTNESRSDTEFEIKNHKGSMISRGIMAGITGQPGDLIIIDDPIKNRQEADSEVYRERIWEEWLNSIKTRLSSIGKVIVIMTRWHEDDLAGRMIKEGTERIHTLNLPCEAEENDPLGREKGDPLFPEIGKDKKWLNQFKKAYQSSEGSRAWNALFQGRPSDKEGTMFKRQWWRYWKPKGVDLPPVAVKIDDQTIYIEAEELPSEFDEELQSWDCAFKDSEKNDFVCGQAWARKAAFKYLIEQDKRHMDIIETMKAILDMSKRRPRARLKLVEDKANGPAVIQMLRKKIGGMVPVEPDGGKESRASAVAPEVESGNVYLPHPLIAPWVNGFIDTCAAFPKVKNDDEVDAMSQALNRMQYRFIKEEKEELTGFYTDTELEDMGVKKYDIRRVK